MVVLQNVMCQVTCPDLFFQTRLGGTPLLRNVSSELKKHYSVMGLRRMLNETKE
jgi:hypothetical protein